MKKIKNITRTAAAPPTWKIVLSRIARLRFPDLPPFPPRRDDDDDVVDGPAAAALAAAASDASCCATNAVHSIAHVCAPSLKHSASHALRMLFLTRRDFIMICSHLCSTAQRRREEAGERERQEEEE